MTAPTATIAERLVQLVGEGVTTTGALKRAMPGTPSQSIYSVLHHLVREGRLVRPLPGNYRIGLCKPPGQPDEPADGPGETTEANDEPAAADGEPTAPGRIGWALWDDGDLVFTVDGEHALHLQAADTERLAVWLQSRVA